MVPVMSVHASRTGAALFLGIGLGTTVLAAGCATEKGVLPHAAMSQWRFTGFPIVAWWGPPGTATREDFEAYRDAGFTLHATNPDAGFARALEHVEGVGLRSLVFRQAQGFALAPLPDVRFPADRDVIVGWITDDEPRGAEQVARSIRAVQGLIRDDPRRWAFFNMLSPTVQQNPSTEAIVDAAVAAGMPVLSYDTYAIMAGGHDRADLLYDHLDRFRLASLRLGVPFWAFALTLAHDGYRRPSESDLRWQHYSNLAYGAKGLWYFTYWGPTDWRGWDTRAIVDPRDGSRTELYDWVKALNRAVLEVGPIVLGLTSLEVVHTSPPLGQRAFESGKGWITGIRARDALLGSFTDPAGTPYALVVNKLHGPGKSARDATDTIELQFSEDVASVEAVSWLDGSPGPLTLRERKASLTVAGGTGVLLRAVRRTATRPGV
jgi:hypothetical protein